MDEDGIGLVLAPASELRSKIINCIHRASTALQEQEEKEDKDNGSRDKVGEAEEEEEVEEEADNGSRDEVGEAEEEEEVEEEAAESLLNIRDALESLEALLSSLQVYSLVLKN
ncbi:Plastid division protein PDV2 [Camellia lanceoleosa]|uniref:Plastid division protein PDV2 n=1 Tax=Camellia lanceoleosa TaxID=1840588 RepID=A0ACC0FKN5_9ERIC|nr:Plastid division protein PDV2 [Camellia lanceoleosa]